MSDIAEIDGSGSVDAYVDPYSNFSDSDSPLNVVEKKTETVFRSCKACFSSRSTASQIRGNTKQPGGSIEIEIKGGWGGNNGPNISMGAAGEIYDKNGNYMKGKITQDSNGNGDISISAGHRKEGPK